MQACFDANERAAVVALEAAIEARQIEGPLRVVESLTALATAGQLDASASTEPRQ